MFLPQLTWCQRWNSTALCPAYQTLMPQVVFLYFYMLFFVLHAQHKHLIMRHQHDSVLFFINVLFFPVKTTIFLPPVLRNHEDKICLSQKKKKRKLSHLLICATPLVRPTVHVNVLSGL